MALLDVAEPFPIFRLAHKYLLYDADTVSYVRQKYSICGVLVGGLPQSPQQNVFLGLPLALMPEEARLLVEKGVAYVVDDARAHKDAFLGGGLSAEERRAFHMALRKQGVSAARDTSRKTDEKKRTALKKKADTENWNDIPEDMLKSPDERRKNKSEESNFSSEVATIHGSEALFDSSSPSPAGSAGFRTAGTKEPEAFAITPTTSYPPLRSTGPALQDELDLPDAPASYHLFKHLHEAGYFLAPGLRFGCQYMAYPGDPLRFHSHFLCNGMEWDQEFDLLDLVGGGRLGTGVKKGFLVGGKEEGPKVDADDADETGGTTRAFCIEWGGM